MPSWKDLVSQVGGGDFEMVVSWPTDQPGWDPTTEVLTVAPCESQLCCKVNPFFTCKRCNSVLCDEHWNKQADKVPPWESGNYCGAFDLSSKTSM